MTSPNGNEWNRLARDELEKYAFKPIFIVGSPRSGTTLMRSIVDAHPKIMCPPCETFLFRTLDQTFNGYIWKDHYRQLPFGRQELVRWLRFFVLELFGNLGISCGKIRWAEKTPSHALSVEFINEVFPDAQFVHVIRNGQDVIRSLEQKSWASKEAEANTKSWLWHVNTCRTSSRKLEPGRYIEIRYEDLLDEPETVLKGLCSFLGEPFDARMLEFHLPRNNSWGRTLKPLKKRTEVGQYQELSPDKQTVFRNLAEPLMRELGYW